MPLKRLGRKYREIQDALFGHDALNEQLRIEQERQRFKIQESATFEEIAIGQQRPKTFHFPKKRKTKNPVRSWNTTFRLFIGGMTVIIQFTFCGYRSPWPRLS